MATAKPAADARPAKPAKPAKAPVAAKTVKTRQPVSSARAPAIQASGASQSAIDEFCDTLWLEDGLAKNSLEAYRRDMTLFAHWLQTQRSKDLLDTDATDVLAYFSARHADTKASSSNRRLAVLKTVFPAGVATKQDQC